MSMPILPVEAQQNFLSKIEEQKNCSVTEGIEDPVENLDPAQLTGQSIITMLNTIMRYLQKYAAWMRDKNMDIAGSVISMNMASALDALDKTRESAEKELAAKESIYMSQIVSGIMNVGITVAGGCAAIPFIEDGKAVIGIGMLTSGLAGGASNIITSGMEAYQAGNITEAQIEKAQADNQRQLLSILETVRSWLSNLAEQMSNQFREINNIVVDIYRSLAKFFETPLV